MKSLNKKEEVASQPAESSRSILQNFKRLDFVINYIPIAKISDEDKSSYQISALPKYTFQQQVKLACKALEMSGFDRAQIRTEVVSTKPNFRKKIQATNTSWVVTYHIDLGLIEIYMAVSEEGINK
jgi:hypothetical protein